MDNIIRYCYRLHKNRILVRILFNLLNWWKCMRDIKWLWRWVRSLSLMGFWVIWKNIWKKHCLKYLVNKKFSIRCLLSRNCLVLVVIIRSSSRNHLSRPLSFSQIGKDKLSSMVSKICLSIWNNSKISLKVTISCFHKMLLIL